MKNIAIQCLLRPALTVVDRCLDYDNFRATIERIDRLLIDSEVESQGVDLALERGQPMKLPVASYGVSKKEIHDHHSINCCNCFFGLPCFLT